MKRLALLLLLGTRLAWADAPDAGVPAPTGLAALPAANPISFKAALEKAQVTLAEPFNLAIEIRHDPKETYRLPAHLDLGDFGIRSHTVDEHGDDPKVTVMRLSMQAFAVGDLNIPAIHLAVDTPDGPKQLEIPPQPIKVAGVIDDSQGPPQMKEDTRPLPTRYRWILWPLWLLLAAIIGIVAALIVRDRKAKAAAAAPPVPRAPPFEEAMARLKALEDEHLIDQGKKQTYYFRLSEIVRDFFGRRYNFESLELTTDELLVTLRKRSTPGLDLDGLARFLRDSDLVKFARSDPSDGACKTILDLARELIVRARPLPEPDLEQQRSA